MCVGNRIAKSDNEPIVAKFRFLKISVFGSFYQKLKQNFEEILWKLVLPQIFALCVSFSKKFFAINYKIFSRNFEEIRITKIFFSTLVGKHLSRNFNKIYPHVSIKVMTFPTGKCFCAQSPRINFIFRQKRLAAHTVHANSRSQLGHLNFICAGFVRQKSATFY
jgi:hypothetical protein